MQNALKQHVYTEYYPSIKPTCESANKGGNKTKQNDPLMAGDLFDVSFIRGIGELHFYAIQNRIMVLIGKGILHLQQR